MNIALVIIDQQKGIDHPKLGKRNNPNAESCILNLLAIWRRNHWPLFHVRHRSSEPESVFWPEQEGFDFKPSFLPREQEIVIEKKVPCAFLGSNFENLLRDRGISSIVITGVATNNSVESSARTAGQLGFSVSVLEDACFTFDQADFYGNPRSAEEVHAMSLANLDVEYARVTDSCTFLADLGVSDH